ncbi:hypothetical protein D3C85_1063510 [compost metagenome]
MRLCSGGDRLLHAVDQEPGGPILNDFGRRTAAEGDDRGAAGQGLDHHQTEGLGPVDREEQGLGPAEEGRLLVVADLADELDQGVAVDHRLDDRLPIGLVRRIDLGRDLQRLAQARGDLDGAVGTFLGRDAAQEGQIALRCGREVIEVARHPVLNRGLPVGVRQGAALIVRDGDQAELGPALIDLGQILQVQPSVQGGDRLVRQTPEEGEVQDVGMEMDDVERVGAVQNGGQQGHVRGQVGLQRLGVQPDRLIAHRDQPRPRLGLGAGEQGHLVAQIDQGVGQVGDDPLGAAVETRRHRLIEGRDLSNLHDPTPAPPMAHWNRQHGSVTGVPAWLER